MEGTLPSFAGLAAELIEAPNRYSRNDLSIPYDSFTGGRPINDPVEPRGPETLVSMLASSPDTMTESRSSVRTAKNEVVSFRVLSPGSLEGFLTADASCTKSAHGATFSGLTFSFRKDPPWTGSLASYNLLSKKEE